jgi:hypothetical protein
MAREVLPPRVFRQWSQKTPLALRLPTFGVWSIFFREKVLFIFPKGSGIKRWVVLQNPLERSGEWRIWFQTLVLACLPPSRSYGAEGLGNREGASQRWRFQRKNESVSFASSKKSAHTPGTCTLQIGGGVLSGGFSPGPSSLSRSW